MSGDPFKDFKEALDNASSENTVLLSVSDGDFDIKVYEGRDFPIVDHEKFLAFYLKFLKEEHGLDPYDVSMRAIQDLQNRIEKDED